MFPPDHARRTCPSCSADLLFRADVQPDLLVVYSSLCLACSSGTVPLPNAEAATVPVTTGRYWPDRAVAADQPALIREAWWDRSSWNALAVWGRADPVLPVERTLWPVTETEAQLVHVDAPVPAEPARGPAPERRLRAPHVPHPVVTRLPSVAPADADDPSDHRASVAQVLSRNEDGGTALASDWNLWEEMDARAEGAGSDSFAFALPTRGRHAKRRKPLPSLRSRLSA
jgi:hypothetical protein